MKNIIKKVLGKEIINRLHSLKRMKKAKSNYKRNNAYYEKKYSFKEREKKIFLIGTPVHGNIGDQAIAEAEIQFIKKTIPEYKIIEISDEEELEFLYYIKRKRVSNSIICLHGGGNMGIEYYDVEVNRRKDILRFRKNIIIIFPQTIYYGNTLWGKWEMKKSAKIYSKCKDLYICARERVSYEQMEKLYNKNNVLLTPDIVLQYKPDIICHKREGVLLCLRNDVESIDKEKKIRRQIENILNQMGKQYKYTDTNLCKRITKDTRKKEINKKLQEISDAELVITDRIHGMIFAALTGTPCIAISNYNHKVEMEYEWLEEIEYIDFAQDITEIHDRIKGFIETICITEHKYNYEIENKFECLKEMLRVEKIG